MQRLNSVLPDWTRVQWTGIENKEKYEKLISSASRNWTNIERMSVVHNLRLCALDTIESGNLLPLIAEYEKYGVLVVPLSREGTSVSYSSTSKEYIPGKPYRLRILFTKSEQIANEFYNIWHSSNPNTRRIGELLGYPQCCVDFYCKHWVDEKFVDTSWPMAVNKLDIDDECRTIHIKEDTPPECNILWRWQGIRLVSHLPCSFDCHETETIGMRNAELGRTLGYEKDIKLMYELLSWPIEWSALHGIAEVKTPINKISTRTDMTPWKYTIQKRSNVYPEDGASGTVYPYTEKKIKIKPVTTTKSFQKSLEDTSVWEENGFSTKEGMDHFHNVILEAIGNMKYIPNGNILDLGCGNGYLLGRIVENNANLIPHGVESNRQRCMSAATTIHWGYFTMGNIFDLNTWKEEYYSLVLLMPGRLLETSTEDVKAFRKQLHDKTDLLLINLTCDWTQKYTNIDNMMNLTGLSEDWEPAGPVIHRNDDMAQLFKRKI